MDPWDLDWDIDPDCLCDEEQDQSSTQKQTGGEPTLQIIVDQLAEVAKVVSQITQVVSNWNIAPNTVPEYILWAMNQPYLNVIAKRYGVNLGTVTPGPATVTLQTGTTAGAVTDTLTTILDEAVNGYFEGNIQNTGPFGMDVTYTQTGADGTPHVFTLINQAAGSYDSGSLSASNPLVGVIKPLRHIKVQVQTHLPGNLTTWALTFSGSQEGST